MKSKFTKNEILKIYTEEYLKNNKSTLALDREYNMGKGYFSRQFKKYNLKMKTHSEATRKYNVNHNYFENIDTPEKAYWLGFIYADGYITTSNTTKRIGISLAIKDKNHLNNFSKCVESNYPIREYKVISGFKTGIKYCRVIINSNKMFDDLRKLGVVENKSLILKPPSIPKDLIKYFILGYFDGDGSICIKNHYNRNTKDWNFSLCGTEEMLNFIMDYFIENNLVMKRNKLYKKHKDSLVCQIAYGGNNVERILTHLYNGFNVKICLKRKYELYIKCKNKQWN